MTTKNHFLQLIPIPSSMSAMKMSEAQRVQDQFARVAAMLYQVLDPEAPSTTAVAGTVMVAGRQALAELDAMQKRVVAEHAESPAVAREQRRNMGKTNLGGMSRVEQAINQSTNVGRKG